MLPSAPPLRSKTRENLDWRWPLACVHSVMMVFSAQLVEGVGSPSPFRSTYPLCSSYVDPSTLSRERLARYSYLYSPTSPLFSSLCLRPFSKESQTFQNIHYLKRTLATSDLTFGMSFLLSLQSILLQCAWLPKL
jgi:hypothetical protein